MELAHSHQRRYRPLRAAVSAPPTTLLGGTGTPDWTCSLRYPPAPIVRLPWSFSSTVFSCASISHRVRGLFSRAGDTFSTKGKALARLPHKQTHGAF